MARCIWEVPFHPRILFRRKKIFPWEEVSSDLLCVASLKLIGGSDHYVSCSAGHMRAERVDARESHQRLKGVPVRKGLSLGPV